MVEKNNVETLDCTQKKVLVAPLDWGLGHATRCIPLIRGLLQRGYQVFLAGEGAQKSLLRAEFTALPFLPLAGYRVQYGASAVQTTGKLLLQIPQVLSAVRREQRWLAQAMAEHQFDVVIADNRYGLHHPEACCILITHQLQIQVPFGLAEKGLRSMHYRLMRPFQACWVPDLAQKPGLSGVLAHPGKLPRVPVQYIGPLSRFSGRFPDASNGSLLLLLSGPEPQRTIFENLLLKQVPGCNRPVVLVRGLPGQSSLPDVPPHVQVFNHLSSAKLEAVVRKAAFVVCRSGYSSVMDLAVLQKKSILVPTPGQTEQQYLARHLHQEGMAIWQKQETFTLAAAVSKAEKFAYRFPDTGGSELLVKALDDLGRQLAVQTS